MEQIEGIAALWKFIVKLDNYCIFDDLRSV